MRTATQRKRRDIRGFTLTETLAVVAVLGILAALIAPRLVQQWRRQQLTELDDAARQIFLTAQSDLTQRKTSGTLETLTADGGAAREEPVGGDVVTTLYYIDSGTAGDSLPKTAVLLSTLSGSYVLYLNPRSGDVTDVYYSKGALTHDAVAALRSQLAGGDDRELRSQDGVGYYGGVSVSSGGTSDETEGGHQAETLELVNREDLYVKLAYPGLESAFTEPQKVEAAITLQDESGGTATVTVTGRPADANGLSSKCWGSIESNNNYTLYVLLDSMAADGSFTRLFPALTPGDDITVTATLSYGGKPLYQNAPIGTVNSLFAAKYKDSAAAGGVTHRKGVEFAYARQLSNLRYYSLGEGAAVQTADIDFTQSARQAAMMPGHTAAAPDTFSPIDLTNSSAQGGITIDGRDGAGTLHKLSNFQISGTDHADNVGLIGGCAVSAAIQNLRLVDCAVSGRAQVGALVGSLSSAGGAVTVTNCGVYQSASGRGSVAGGRGASSGADTPTGGLIGEARAAGGNAILIQQCFSALAVANSQQVTGGLIGRVGGGTSSAPVTVQSSYASGSAAAGTANAYRSTAGGLIGAAENTAAIGGSYSSADVYGSAYCGGLVGSNTGTLSVTGSYACGTVTTGSALTYGPLVCGSGAAAYSSCQYLDQSGNTAAADGYSGTVPSGVTACEYDDLAKSVNNTAAKCHPYRSALRGKAYPFAMVTAEYYGDWPDRYDPVQKVAVPYGLCYYEKYTDSAGTVSWGFYGYDKNGNLADSLDYANSRTISVVGYGELVPSGTANVKAPCLGGKSNPWSTAVFDDKIALSSLGQDLYPLRNGGSDLLNHDNQVDIKIYDAQLDRDVYLNPLFAATLSTEILRANESQPMQIRTETQLRNRSRISNGWYFQQTHSIVVTLADTGGLSNNDVNSAFDGKGNTISGLRTPLFQSNNGTIKNVSLVNVSINQSGDMAALAVSSQGTVKNCSVLSGSVTSSGSAAGLIANSNGSSTASVSDCTVNCTVTSTNGSAGGLMVKSQSPVTNCSFTGTVTAAGDAAGLAVTNASDGNSKISSCTVSGTVSSGGGNAAGLAVTNDWSASIANCAMSGSVTAQQGGKTAVGAVITNNGSIKLTYSTAAVAVAGSGGSASGFVDTMGGGSVSYCYYNGTVSAAGGTAAGFCRNDGQGGISNCFAVGAVSASGGTAAGFAVSITKDNGSVANCYAAVAVSGSTQYGFAGSGTSCTGCYWVQQSGTGLTDFNKTLPVSQNSSGKIDSIPFAQLKNLNTPAVGWPWDSGDSSWTLTTTADQTHPVSDVLKGKAYPYPRISGLDFYGNWPY